MSADIANIDVYPHAIFDEGLGVAAIGFLTHLRRRKGLPGRSRIDVPTSDFDQTVDCSSLAEAHYRATALALRGFAERRPDLVHRRIRLLTQDGGVNFVVKMHGTPAASENVAKDLETVRANLVTGLAPYRAFFRFPYYDRDDKPLPKPLVVRRANMVRSLQARLLRTQFGRRTPPKARGLTVDLDAIGRLRLGHPQLSVRQAIVGHLRRQGVKTARIAEALALKPRDVRNALGRYNLAMKFSASAPIVQSV